LISSSQYSIHDISRIEIDNDNAYPRFNMPFELGLEIGYKYYCSSDKKVLIMEKDEYISKKYLSDLAGVDIINHQKDQSKLIKGLRDWFYVNVIPENIRNGMLYPTIIWDRYNDFSMSLLSVARNQNVSEEEVKNCNLTEYKDYIKSWLSTRT
jgi:hypothetical protein